MSSPTEVRPSKSDKHRHEASSGHKVSAWKQFLPSLFQRMLQDQTNDDAASLFVWCRHLCEQRHLKKAQDDPKYKDKNEADIPKPKKIYKDTMHEFMRMTGLRWLPKWPPIETVNLALKPGMNDTPHNYFCTF
jgi:hypothetical protein